MAELSGRSLRFGNVVPLSRRVEPHPHYSIGRGIVEHFFRSSPVGLRLLRLAVSTDEKTRNETANKNDGNDSEHESHRSLRPCRRR
jgi:hypothetical protein